MEINWNLGSIRVMANLVFEKFEALLSAGMSEEGVGVILRLPTPPITCETDYCKFFEYNVIHFLILVEA